MADRADITPELLRQLLRYEPETGKYFWRRRPREMFASQLGFACWNRKFTDAEAMTFVNVRGYIAVSIFSRIIGGHRVVWAYHYGEWPKGQIDHINGIKTDNRIENLRDVTPAENGQNLRLGKNNTSGCYGVSWNKNSKVWHAEITVCGKRHHLGCFREKDDAIKARKLAENKFGFHPNHGNTR